MTRYQPLWQQTGTYQAVQDRYLMAGAWPAGGLAEVYPLATYGIWSPASTLNVNIPPNTAFVPLNSPAGSGVAVCRWDASEQVTLSAGSGANPRIDLIVCQVRDNTLDAGGNNDFIFSVVAGTPAATPAVPATPNNALAVGTVQVPTSAANLNAATFNMVGAGLVGGPAAGYTGAATTVQSFTDSFGDVWVAKAGVNNGMYRRATDVMHCRYWLNGAMNTGGTPSTYVAVVWDSRSRDPYAIGATGASNLTVPIAGLWKVHLNVAFSLASTATCTGGIFLNGTQASYANVVGTATSAYYMAPCDDTLLCAASDLISARVQSSVANSTVGVGASGVVTYITLDYLGTG